MGNTASEQIIYRPTAGKIMKTSDIQYVIQGIVIN
jgi:hypothetical protein